MMLTSNNSNNSNNSSSNKSSIPLEQLSNTNITTTDNNILFDSTFGTPMTTNTTTTTTTTTSTNSIDNIVTVSNRMKDDICYCLFGNTLDKIIHRILHFTTIINAQNRLQIQAFAHQQTLFLMFSKETIDEVFSWSLTRFQTWFTYLIDIIEQETGCVYMIVAINKQQNKVETILRTFYYIGFQLVKPSVYNHSSDYVLVGYRLDD